VYKKCFHCGNYTDADEKNCPCCGGNPFEEEIISFEDIITRIKNGEINSQQIWTKSPIVICQALGSPPQ